MSVEREMIGVVAEMLRYPQFHFPLAAAQRQYREHYYGLSSAALLEDLYFDTLWSFLAQLHPTVTLERPPRGERGWDYSFQGHRVSHKVGQGPQEIAALWDATQTGITQWTFDFPIAYHCSGYKPVRLELSNDFGRLRVKAISGDPYETVGQGRGLLVLHWDAGAEATIVHSSIANREQPVIELLGFEEAWTVVAALLAEGRAANHIEVVTTTAQVRGAEARLVQAGTTVRMTAEHRPGIYVFPSASLVHVPVRTNNRAVLLGRDTVAQLMSDARAAGLFAPLPIWFAAYAGHRPPDLYLTQRAEFDSLFSPTRVARAADMAARGLGVEVDRPLDQRALGSLLDP